jgi:hypothetical protein
MEPATIRQQFTGSTEIYQCSRYECFEASQDPQLQVPFLCGSKLTSYEDTKRRPGYQIPAELHG